MGGLFSSIVVGGMEIPSRIFMPPMTTRLADEEGHVTDARYRYGLGRPVLRLGDAAQAGKARAAIDGAFRAALLSE